MRIAEIYASVQGEGRLTGTPSAFVRTSGCNLRCVYCDTPFASWRPEGDDLAVEQIVGQVRQTGLRHVVLTGGEPMLFAELVPLCDELRQVGLHITIETAGTLFLPVNCDLMSISPKLSNSAPPAAQFPDWHTRHESTRENLAVVRQLIEASAYQLKFVVGSPSDADEARRYLELLSGVQPERVMLMPEGTNVDRLRAVEDWLRPYCKGHGLTFCPRRQIEWFGHIRQT